jgi:hypothetical protein
MHTTDQILAGHVAVGHEGATVKTSAVEHSDFVIGAHDRSRIRLAFKI